MMGAASTHRANAVIARQADAAIDAISERLDRHALREEVRRLRALLAERERTDKKRVRQVLLLRAALTHAREQRRAEVAAHESAYRMVVGKLARVLGWTAEAKP